MNEDDCEKMTIADFVADALAQRIGPKEAP